MFALSLLSGEATAETNDEVRISRAGAQPSIQGAAENFTGAVQVDGLFKAELPARVSGGTVTFEPGARTAWHTHPLGQTLVVTAGVGYVQQQGGPRQEIRTGDIVWIPPHVRHWHGATPTTGMTHVAIAEAEDGKTVTWAEQVSDTEYANGSAEPILPDTPPASDTLSPRQQAIALIAAAMAVSDMPKLNAAIDQGLDDGLTVSEIREVLVQLYAYVGFPRSLNALDELMKRVQARKQRGINDTQGREPARGIPTGAALLAAGMANQTRISGGPVKGAVFEFAPVINQYLQAHLFGDIFERDNLDWQSRELATVAALAATTGVEAQLRSHMRASLRVGLSAGQLQQVTELLAQHMDGQTARRASAALAQAASGGGR
ncbi:MAG TPA: cupin domain-containing protein [Pseudomonas sp.]